MAQRIAHGHEVGLRVGQGNGLAEGFDGFHRHLLAQLGQHAGRRVDRDHPARRTDQLDPGDRDQAGAGRHVHQRHAGGQAVAPEHVAPVPGAAAQGGQALGIVVAARGLVEHGLGELAPFAFALEIGAQARVVLERAFSLAGVVHVSDPIQKDVARPAEANGARSR
ncbi:hypothetical protein FQZ97_973310 [compost metagenome]